MAGFDLGLGLEGFGPRLLAGAWLTVQLALAALAFGFALAVAGAAAKLSRRRALRWLGDAYSDVFKGLPEFLTVLIIYFGGSAMLTRLLGGPEGDFVDMGPFLAGVIALGLTFGAFASEVLRGAFAALPPGQSEAGLALGLTRWQVFWAVRLPQAWRLALPGLGNLFLILLKDTSLVSLVGLGDLMREAGQAARFTREPFTFYLAAAALYLLMTLIATGGLKALERRAARGSVAG